MSELCPRCSAAPRGTTHVCPPPETSSMSPALASALVIRIGPRCPVCFRDDGSHSLGCSVEAYVDGWKSLRGDA